MSPRKKPLKKHVTSPIGRLFIILGIVLIITGLCVFTAIFWPVIYNEYHYRFAQFRGPVLVTNDSVPHNIVATIIMTPKDEQFGIVIPKIDANTSVIPNVDPYDSHIYQRALTKGVAHAKGTVFPGRVGNMFIFSHSSVNFYDAMRFNSVFYLLDKLEPGDPVYIFFEKQKYTYVVTEKKLVSPTDISYLTEKTNDKLLTLMTCWPPGTTIKRLIIRTKLQTP